MALSPRPLVERLAARRLLAAIVEGTLAPDLIRVESTATLLRIDVNGTTTTYPLEQVDSLLVIGDDGADTLTLDSIGQIPTTIDGGAGDDQITAGGGDWRANLDADVSLRGGLGNDRVVIDDTLAPTISLEITNPFNLDTRLAVAGGGGGTIFVDAGTPESSVEQIDLRLGDGDDAINLAGLSSFTSLALLGGAGDDTVNVGNDYDSLINGNVTLDGGAGRNALLIDDSADAFTDTYLFAGTSAAPTFGKDSTPALLRYTNVGDIRLVAGGASPFPTQQFFRITALPLASNLDIRAGTGDDVFTVGSATQDLSTLQAELLLDGEAGFDRLEVFDVVGTDAATYTVTPSALHLTGELPIRYASMQFITLRGNGAANRFEMLGTPSPTAVTLDGGAGDDLFLVGDGDLDTNLGNGVSLVGGAGNDSLVIDDRLDDPGNDTYTFSGGLMNRALAGVLWSTSTAAAVEKVELLGSANADAIRVTATSPTVTLRINAGEGDDTINVERTSDGAAAATPVFVDSGAGDDSLSVNSDGVNADAIVTLDGATETLGGLNVRGGGRLNLAEGDRLLRVNGTLAVAGTLDLGDGTLLVRGGSAPALNTLLASGYDNGAWAGAAPAIVSSTAAASQRTDALGLAPAAAIGLPVLGGVATESGDVVVRYTLAGDTNLDRVVGFDDLLVVAQAYDPSAGGLLWFEGNFNYLTPDTVAGAAGFDDLLALAQNYNAARFIRPVRR